MKSDKVLIIASVILLILINIVFYSSPKSSFGYGDFGGG